MKNEKFTLTKEIFRQINYLVIYLVKPLFSRNFPQKCVRENSRNFHTVHVKQCENCRNSLSHFFRKNLVKAMGLKEITI